MQKWKVDAAKVEAVRFLARINDLPAARKVGSTEHHDGGKETGALRRASMDLTRALAELRR